MAGIRVAIEGCGHGTLNAIYASVDTACQSKGWDGVDLLIIGGDFQAVRNTFDLNCMAVPPKYREIGDFHEYYSGARKAPYLTIFVGGNHEASNHLFELYYGGWVAPNIYYMGAANVLKLGPLRIAGMSGIWKGYNYRKPHYERLPYNQDDIRSIYHVREIDVRKLLQIRTQVDAGISHDWPQGVEWLGDHQALFRQKDHFRDDAKTGRLGSIAAKQVLKHLRPYQWFAAHLHVRYTAVVGHENANGPVNGSSSNTTVNNPISESRNPDQIDLDMDDEGVADGDDDASAPIAVASNPEEIELDLEDDDSPQNSTTASSAANAQPKGPDEDLRADLPASFARQAPTPRRPDPPTEIKNDTTKFLALDKCLPRRSFLQLLDLEPRDANETISRPLALQYDPEWLAITKVFANDIVVGDPDVSVPKDEGRAAYLPRIEEAERWVHEHIVEKQKLSVPTDFTLTAPAYNQHDQHSDNEMPREYSNPQTTQFCELLQIPNPFSLSEDEVNARIEAGPRPATNAGSGSFHRGRRGSGRGFGRPQGRGAGRGRGHRGHH